MLHSEGHGNVPGKSVEERFRVGCHLRIVTVEVSSSRIQTCAQNGFQRLMQTCAQKYSSLHTAIHAYIYASHIYRV